jgi:glycosyltransferase involved in cell wall biosynthesis
VALDARPLQTASGGRGIGRYVRELAPRLARRPEVDRLLLHLDARRPDPPGLPGGPHLRPVRTAGLPGPASLTDRLAPSRELMDEGTEIYHATFLPPPRLPAGVATVLTVHDLIPLMASGSVPPRAALVSRLAFAGAAACDRIVAVSRYTARTVQDHLGLPPERILVTHLGVDSKTFTPGPAPTCPPLEGSYLLHVGGFDPEKNLELLLDVAQRLAADPGGDVPRLVVAGDGGARASLFAARVRRRGLEGWVHLSGRLPEGSLAAAYAGATLFLFPSRQEGFGLPPLEAMSCGCPVLASRAASLPEVVGEAGVLLPPDDPSAWAEAVRRLMADPGRRRALSEAGRRRAARFTWEATASATIRAYREARAVS